MGKIKKLERNISVKLNLSDADCIEVYDLLGNYGITLDRLFSNFLSDLIYGSNCIGVDKTMLAEKYFNNRYFDGVHPKESFLRFLIESLMISDFLNIYQILEKLREEASAADEERMLEVKNEIELRENELNIFYSEYVESIMYPESGMPESFQDGLKDILEWNESRNKLLNQLPNGNCFTDSNQLVTETTDK